MHVISKKPALTERRKCATDAVYSRLSEKLSQDVGLNAILFAKLA